jgi:hypothetical protein
MIMPARKNQFKEFPAGSRLPTVGRTIAANNVRQKFFNSQFGPQRDSLAA